MATRTFQVRMPQLVAAFVPMYMVPAIFGARVGKLHTVPWIVDAITVLIALVGFVLMFVYGFKKYPIIVEDSGITVIKRRITPEEIIAIRLTRTSLNIMTSTWRKRGLVTFEKMDLAFATEALHQFASQHDIRLEIK